MVRVFSHEPLDDVNLLDESPQGVLVLTVAGDVGRPELRGVTRGDDRRDPQMHSAAGQIFLCKRLREYRLNGCLWPWAQVSCNLLDRNIQLRGNFQKGPDYLTAHSALPEPRKVGVVVRVGGPRLHGRQVRVEVQGGDVILEQLSDSEREIVMPENVPR